MIGRANVTAIRSPLASNSCFHGVFETVGAPLSERDLSIGASKIRKRIRASGQSLLWL